jgi:hypothetical protein
VIRPRGRSKPIRSTASSRAPGRDSGKQARSPARAPGAPRSAVPRSPSGLPPVEGALSVVGASLEVSQDAGGRLEVAEGHLQDSGRRRLRRSSGGWDPSCGQGSTAMTPLTAWPHRRPLRRAPQVTPSGEAPRDRGQGLRGHRFDQVRVEPGHPGLTEEAGTVVGRHGDEENRVIRGFSRTRRANSNPSMTGIMRSQKTTAGCPRASVARPAEPSAASSTRAPRPLRGGTMNHASRHDRR